MRLPLISARRCHAILVIAMVFAVLPSSIATAGPILVSFNVTFAQSGFSDEFDLGVAVSGAKEIYRGSGTNVGEVATFFDDEYIDITSDVSMTSLEYMIQGGLAAHPVAAGYSTSWPAVTTLLFSNFVLDQPGTLASVTVTGLAGVVGAGGLAALDLGVDYVVTADSLQLNIDPLGIFGPVGQTPLGRMTFQLNFVADEPPVNVPEPASTLTLFGMGMAALAARRRLARRR